MTEAARWNLQHGVPENKAYEWTDYTPTSDLDRWIVHHMKIREQFLKKQEYDRQVKAEAEQLAKDIEKQLEKELDKLLKDFK